MYWNSESGRNSGSTVMLNSNIRCIEISLNRILLHCITSWIVTLDVLKYSVIVYCCHISTGWIVTLDVLKWLIARV